MALVLGIEREFVILLLFLIVVFAPIIGGNILLWYTRYKSRKLIRERYHDVYIRFFEGDPGVATSMAFHPFSRYRFPALSYGFEFTLGRLNFDEDLKRIHRIGLFGWLMILLAFIFVIVVKVFFNP